jgi:hypothetical protein
VVVQVVVFLLDDILEVVLGACSLPFDDRKTPQYQIALKSDRQLLSSSYLRSDGQTGKSQQPQLRNFWLKMQLKTSSYGDAVGIKIIKQVEFLYLRNNTKRSSVC